MLLAQLGNMIDKADAIGALELSDRLEEARLKAEQLLAETDPPMEG